jgi:hypothetical protein
MSHRDRRAATDGNLSRGGRSEFSDVVIGCAAAIFLGPFIFLLFHILVVVGGVRVEWALQQRARAIVNVAFGWSWLSLFVWWHRTNWRSGDFMGGVIVLANLAIAAMDLPVWVIGRSPGGPLEVASTVVSVLVFPVYILWVLAGRRR